MRVLVISVLMLLSVTAGWAQNSLLMGTVYDENGAVIPKVKIRAVGPDGLKFETVTDKIGSYSLRLPFSKVSSDVVGMVKYRIIFERSDLPFETKELVDFLFVSSTKGKMFLDCVLLVKKQEPNIHY
ncbi:MAG: carboxypeptidase-like regulatory domain-containing protein [Pyrinomonadaceae bacterium]